MVEKYRFGIVGVGPAGGIMAAYLSNSGYDVVLVDILKSHMDEIKKSGLIISHPKELKAQFPKENICYSIDELKEKQVDFLFIAVKASLLDGILPQLKKVVKQGTAIISLQNGFDTEELIAEYFGKENTFRIIVNYAGNLQFPGIIRMSFFNPPNYIGIITPTAEEKAKKLGKIITEAGLETSFTHEIKRHEWIKCILNTISPICVTSRRTMKQVMEFADTREFIRELLKEGITVAKARGIEFEPEFIESCMSYLDKAGHHKVSMQVDIEHGTPTEIEFLNGKIVEYGKIVGIPTPLNKLFVALIRACELPHINLRLF
ncbi:MAG: ketopantoate reductase family protein [Promethearchaeota archaeon]|jgi:2-dehydropantoate 2-reductase